MGIKKSCVLLGLSLALWAGPVKGATINDWIAYYHRNPKDQKAVELLSRHFKVSPVMVDARIEAEALLQRLPEGVKSPEFVLPLVGLLEQVGDFPKAREVLNRHLNENKNNIQGVIMMGWLFYQEGKYKDALEWYDLAIQKGPNVIEGYHGRMLVTTALGNNGEAKRMGTLILSRKPNDFYAAVRMGNILYGEELYQESLKFYSLIKETPDGRLGIGLCHFKLKEYDKARNFLYSALYDFPANVQVQQAVFDLQQREIKDLKWELLSPKLTEAERVNKNLRVAYLLDAMGNSLEDKSFLVELLPRAPDFDQHIRVAGLLQLSHHYAEAGKQFEIAAAKSPRPRNTLLAAVDSYIAAKNYEYAQSLLNTLAKEKPGFDLDRRQAAIYMQTKQVERGRQIFFHGARFYEEMAKQRPDSFEWYLKAIDTLLAGKMYNEATELIGKLNIQFAGFALDSRLARIAFEQKRYHEAIEIYEKYPLSIPMQISKGWSYFHTRRPRMAEKTFRDILKNYPEHPEALRGVRTTLPIAAWEAFGVYTILEYGNYQDSRGLKTAILGYDYRGQDKAVSKFSYTKTNVLGVSPGNVDFQEDLYGFKFFYRWDKKWASQIHGLYFSNNDDLTDRATPWGMTSYFFPDERWTLALETNSSRYNHAYAWQLVPSIGLKLSFRWRLDMLANYSRISGTNVRTTIPRDYTAANTTITYRPNKKLTLSGSAWLGERKMSLDSEGLFSYNILDLYKEAGILTLLYKFRHNLQLYGRYSLSHFESEWQAAANEVAGTRLFDPDQTVSLLSLGLDGFF